MPAPTDAGRRPTPLPAALVPAALRDAIEQRCARTGCDDRVAVGSVLVRDLVVPLTRLVVASWSETRVVPDVSSANLLVDLTVDEPVVALAEQRWAGPGEDDALLLDRVEAWLLDDTVALAVHALRGVVRVGARHLWGSVALAVVNTLASLDHRTDSRAEADLALLLGRRPELAALVDIVTTANDAGRSITYAIRKTCCLLVKVPPGEMCGTCSLRPRAERIRACDEHYRRERAASSA